MKSDICALGYSIYDIFMNEILKNNNNISKFVKNFILLCLNIDHQARPTSGYNDCVNLYVVNDKILYYLFDHGILLQDLEKIIIYLKISKLIF